MKNKYKKNISNISKITNIINNPIENKKLAFLFGSGINNNIAKENNLNWNNLGKKVIYDFLDEKLNDRNKWEKTILSNEINKEIDDNKISCSFLNKNKIKINSKSEKENNWFQKGFDLFEEKFSYGIIVTTLNYDRVIKENLKGREAINFLFNPSINPKKEILHLHGLVDEENYIYEGDGILTLSDYVKNSSNIEERFFHFLFGNAKGEKNLKDKEFDFTLLIIGTSLKEQHLLNSINRFCNECEKNNLTNIRIFLIVHLDWNDLIFKKYQEIYKNIKIEIININFGGTYEKDFKVFWKKMINKIEKNDFNFDQVNFRKNDIFLDNDLYKILENEFKTKKDVSINQIINFIKPKFKLKNLLIRPIYWLEKKDGIVKNKTLKNYILMQDDSNQFEEIEINQFFWIENEEFSTREINLILKEIEKFIKNKSYHLDFHIEQFILKQYKKIDFEKHKNIHIFLVIKIAREKLPIEIEKYILDKTFFSKTFSEDWILNKWIFRLSSDYFKTGNPITKIIENTLQKNKNWFKFKIPKNSKDIFGIVLKWKKYYDTRLLFYFFSIKKYKKMIFENLDFNLDILTNILKNEGSNKSNYLFFTLLCFIFLNSKKENDFIQKLKLKKINNFFKSYPSWKDYIGFFSPRMPPFSKHDDTLIVTKVDLNSYDKILTFSKNNNYANANERIAISKFLNKELNDFSKKDRNIKWLKELNELNSVIFFFLTIQINTPDWKTYLEFISNIKKIKLERLYIKPPYEISKRLDYLLDQFSKNKNEKNINKILIITKIKFTLKYYLTYFIFYNKEIRFLLEYSRNKKSKNKKLISKIKTFLNEIFRKKFEWLNIDYEEYLLKNEEPKELEEILFIYSFSKKISSRIPPKIDLLFDLMDEDLKDKKLLKERIVFDHFLRILKFNIQNLKEDSQKINNFIILINKIKNTNINEEDVLFWKEHLISLIIYYQIFESWQIQNEKEWSQIEKVTSDVIRAISYYYVDPNNNLLEKKDKKIANYLEKKYDDKDKFLKVCTELFNLEKNIKYLGKKTLKSLIDIFKHYKKYDKEYYSLKKNKKFISIREKIKKSLKKNKK